MVPKLPTFAWTLTGNYPAGGNPWNSQPLAVKPAGSYVNPNTVPDAEDYNWIWGTQASDVGNVFQYVGSEMALNWPISATALGNNLFTSFTADSIMAACYEYNTGKWWFALKDHNGSNQLFTVFSTVDGSDYFNFVTSGPGFNPIIATPSIGWVAMTPDPTTFGMNWFGYVDQSAIATVNVYTVAGASWTLKASIGLGATGPARVTNHTFNGHVLWGIGAPQANAAFICRDYPYVNGISGVTCQYFVFGDNFLNGPGNLCIAMNTNTSAGNYWTTPDGVTWTAQSFALLGGGTIPNMGSMNAFGVVWTHDAQGDCWLLGFQYGSEPVFYRSTDGINWSLQSQPTNFSGALGTCATMAAVGSVVVVSGSDGYSGAYSTDGGVTWFKSTSATINPQPGYVTGNLTPGSGWYMQNTVLAGHDGFMVCNSVALKFGMRAGAAISIN